MRDGGVRVRHVGARALLVPVLVYGALWPLMDVGFLAHHFALPFLGGLPFFRRYAHMVGGPAQWAASLFTQAYSRHWAAVLAFTLLALAAWAIARGILRRFSPGSCTWTAAAFPVLILTLANRDLSVLYILPMVAGLAVAWLYVALADLPRRPSARTAFVALFLLASVPVYYLLASGFLSLCLTCALFEWLVRKRPAWGLAWLACGAAVPYGVSLVLFEPDLAARYLRWTTLPRRDPITMGVVAAMYAFVPAGALLVYFVRTVRLADRLTPRTLHALRIAGFAALVLLAVRLVATRVDTSGWMYADYLIDDGRPEEALASLAASEDDGEPARHLTMYALGRTGRIPWEMFHYPQRASSDALLLRDTVWDTVPVVSDWRSDLYLELGRVNESQRWAHEALAVGGETPRVLERMALVYLLNGNPEAARSFVRALERVPFQASRARTFLAAIDRDPTLRGNPLADRVRPLMLQQDYIGPFTTEEILQQCLETNPSNRMAFEYLLAHYLLTSDMEGLAKLAPRLKDFYRELPTHVQEALVGYKNLNGSLPPGVDGSAIDSELETRFQRFFEIWNRKKDGPADEAWNALAPSFGATWWFFFAFDRTAAGPRFEADPGTADQPEPTP